MINRLSPHFLFEVTMKFREIFESIPSDLVIKIKNLRDSSVGFKGKIPTVVYRGVSPISGSNAARFGKGLWLCDDK